MGDDIVELHTENESIKNENGSYDEKWLEQSIARLLQQIDDEKRANLIMFGMKKQMNKKMNYSYTYSNTNKSIIINPTHIFVKIP